MFDSLKFEMFRSFIAKPRSKVWLQELGRRWPLQFLNCSLPEFQFLLDFANRTGGGIALSVLQQNQILALEHWLKLLDLVNVDDYRAADAQESLRREMGF